MIKLALLSALLAFAVAVGVIYDPFAFVVAVFSAGAALYQAYYLGARQGFIVDEDMLPPEIYQVIAITMAGNSPVAILRNSKKKRIACRSCISASGGFAYFSVAGEGNEKFFVPDSLKRATTAGSSVAGSDLANSHGGVGKYLQPKGSRK